MFREFWFKVYRSFTTFALMLILGLLAPAAWASAPVPPGSLSLPVQVWFELLSAVLPQLALGVIGTVMLSLLLAGQLQLQRTKV